MTRPESARALPLRNCARVILDTRHVATCLICGEPWATESKGEFSHCCRSRRCKPGEQPLGLPARHPFRQPMAGDRLSKSGISRTVLRILSGFVEYASSKHPEIAQCSLHEWERWATGHTAGGWVRVAARVERRGDL